MKKLLLNAALVVAALIPIGLQGWVVSVTGFAAGDFRAFYCAAHAVMQHADPYLNEPLHSCEASIGPKTFFAKFPGVTVPAPLPGYSLAVVIPFALLPFSIAATLWLLLLFVAWYVCIATLSRVTRVSWQIALAATALSIGANSIPFGEVAPIAIAAVCAAAYYAQRERWIAAALAAAVAMIEPHLGLPVCVALAVWAPRTRLTTAACLAGLGLASFLVLGAATNVEYIVSVLPAHALSEVVRDTQYSLTAILASAGVGARAAIVAGSVWYLAMLLAGIATAGLLYKRTRDAAFLAFVPVAFAVLGGTFVHITQIAAAVPAALLVFPLLNQRPILRTACAIALLLLVVPWNFSVYNAIAPAFPVAYLAWIYFERSIRATAIAVVASGAYITLLSLHLGAWMPPHWNAVIDPRLAEATWAAFTYESSSHGLSSWLNRLPTWIGLTLVLGTLLAGSLRTAPISTGSS